MEPHLAVRNARGIARTHQSDRVDRAEGMQLGGKQRLWWLRLVLADSRLDAVNEE
jgi:hypothetical protein